MPSCSGAANANNYDVLTCAGQNFISARSIGRLFCGNMPFLIALILESSYDFKIRLDQIIQRAGELLKMLNFNQGNHAFIKYLWEGGWVVSGSSLLSFSAGSGACSFKFNSPPWPTWNSWSERAPWKVTASSMWKMRKNEEMIPEQGPFLSRFCGPSSLPLFSKAIQSYAVESDFTKVLL